MDAVKFLGGATNLGFSLDAFKSSETTRLFPYEGFGHLDKMQNKNTPLCHFLQSAA